MRKALIVVVAALVTSAAVVLASSSTREGAQEQAAPAWAKNSCRDAVAAAEFARPIGRARPLVARMKTAFGAPGLQLAVAVDGKIVWSRVCGLADVARSTATTRTTLFRIGSVSKTFTATALARLAQSGTVDLDVPVQTYVPDVPGEARHHHARAPRLTPGRHPALPRRRGPEHRPLRVDHRQPAHRCSRPAPLPSRQRLLLLELRVQPARRRARGSIRRTLRRGSTPGGLRAARVGAHPARRARGARAGRALRGSR